MHLKRTHAGQDNQEAAEAVCSSGADPSLGLLFSHSTYATERLHTELRSQKVHKLTVMPLMFLKDYFLVSHVKVEIDQTGQAGHVDP